MYLGLIVLNNLLVILVIFSILSGSKRNKQQLFILRCNLLHRGKCLLTLKFVIRYFHRRLIAFFRWCLQWENFMFHLALEQYLLGRRIYRSSDRIAVRQFYHRGSLCAISWYVTCIYFVICLCCYIVGAPINDVCGAKATYNFLNAASSGKMRENFKLKPFLMSVNNLYLCAFLFLFYIYSVNFKVLIKNAIHIGYRLSLRQEWPFFKIHVLKEYVNNLGQLGF